MVITQFHCLVQDCGDPYTIWKDKKRASRHGSRVVMPSPRFMLYWGLLTLNKLGVFLQICFYEAPMPPGVWYERLSLIFFQSDGLNHFFFNLQSTIYRCWIFYSNSNYYRLLLKYNVQSIGHHLQIAIMFSSCTVDRDFL